MSTVSLTPTSYVVLGLVEILEPATPYALKRAAQTSVFNFWYLPHTQLYIESGRLAEAGYLDEEREEAGRRRRIYRLTEAGRHALDAWRAEPPGHLNEFRDLGLLKLFFGADPAAIAAAELAAHEERLASFERLHAEMPMTEGQRLALEAGIGHEREFARFWSELSRLGAPATR